MRCHTQASGYVLGVSTNQSHRRNQLQTWNQMGLFQTDIGAGPFLALAAVTDGTRSLAERARSYLHSNCANCHQPGGTTAMDMDLRYSATNMNVINVPATAGDLGLTNPARVRPGSAASSVLVERMRRTDSSRMPPLGSELPDEEAIQVLQQWINGL